MRKGESKGAGNKEENLTPERVISIPQTPQEDTRGKKEDRVEKNLNKQRLDEEKLVTEYD